ncbi:head maturation protease, ClpP-related [Calidifontibacter indicus]|uniref:head maturation protease, ClpP-related n=1 Tax=Calidifontibacter indicus TaxID=419650 RepID=UPI003D71E8F9
MTTNPLQRVVALAKTPRTPVRAEAPTSGTVAKLYLYDQISSSDWWGVGAKDVVEALKGINADTLEVHINSPGGEVWEGIAIANLLRDHSARIVVVVDGLAASIASLIAVSADEVVMATGSQMMIHDASGLCWGQASDMAKMADDLDKISTNIADQYAAKAGGASSDWRELMLAETWYSAQEAVDAGLADRVSGPAPTDDTAAAARWDLSVFAHAGRQDAPAPSFPPNRTPMTPAASASGSAPALPDDPQEGSPIVELTDAQLTALRQRVGVQGDADLDTILAALDECLEERADAPAAQTVTAAPEGMVLVDETVHAQLVSDAAAGRAAYEQQQTDRRVQLVNAAVQDGRITPASRDRWLTKLTSDPDDGEPLLAALPKGLVPLAETGHSASHTTADGSQDDVLYNQVYPAAAGQEG